MTPFKCEKSGQEFLQAEGGQCALCHRFLLLGYLRENLYPKQKSPICVDCLQEIEQLILSDKIPKEMVKEIKCLPMEKDKEQ